MTTTSSARLWILLALCTLLLAAAVFADFLILAPSISWVSNGGVRPGVFPLPVIAAGVLIAVIVAMAVLLAELLSLSSVFRSVAEIPSALRLRMAIVTGFFLIANVATHVALVLLAWLILENQFSDSGQLATTVHLLSGLSDLVDELALLAISGLPLAISGLTVVLMRLLSGIVGSGARSDIGNAGTVTRL